MNRDRWLHLIVGAMVMLFFVQALRALFSTMFGILYDQIFAGTPTAWLPVSLLLVLLSMAAPRLAVVGEPGAKASCRTKVSFFSGSRSSFTGRMTAFEVWPALNVI